MAIFVNTNVGSLHGRNQLNNVNKQLDTTYQRLSSGLRINSAKDDAAGLQIADRMTSQINGLNQGNRNAADAIALMQTMEGGIDEVGNILQRIRTLAVQSANGTNTQEDRNALTRESFQLSKEIARIASQTKFGGKTILNGHVNGANDIFSASNTEKEDGKITFQIGANSGDSLELTVMSFALSILMDKGAKAAPGDTAKTNGFMKATAPNANVGYASGDILFTLTSAEAAQKAIKSIDDILNKVDSERANLGANINRLESTIRSQSNTVANQSDARSRIRDTDFAAESANLSQQNIIQQAATSMLMQANARPQLALSLLG